MIVGWSPIFDACECTHFISFFGWKDFRFVILNNTAYSSWWDSNYPFLNGIPTEKNAPNLIPFLD